MAIREMEKTVHAAADSTQNTIPSVCCGISAQRKVPILHRGGVLGEFRLVSPMSVTGVSEVWFAVDGYGEQYAAKAARLHPDRELLERIRLLDCENLMELIDCGEEEGVWYEIYPYYKNGCLSGVLSEEQIREKVLPGLINALEHLHGSGIIHNDIKPENIFWDDGFGSVVLGDYSCISRKRTQPAGYTFSYAAPEILLGDVCKSASDWLSTGLTLAKLSGGDGLVKAESAQEACMRWEQGIRFTGGSALFRQLVNGMLHADPKRRLGPNAAKKWCGNAAFGGEERIVSHGRTDREPVTVAFENPAWIAADLRGLLKGIEEHWDYAVFLHQQGRLDRFLRQFDLELGEKSRNYRRLPNGEAALFQLTLAVARGESFIWRGTAYRDLTEMEEKWGQGGLSEKDIVTFLQCGLAAYYLEKKGATREQLAYVKRLQDLSRVHAFEACSQLFQALRGDDGLRWENEVLHDLRDVVNWLSERVPALDEEIDKFFRDRRFEAWMAYQGMGDIFREIRRKCEI